MAIQLVMQSVLVNALRCDTSAGCAGPDGAHPAPQGLLLNEQADEHPIGVADDPETAQWRD